MLGLECLDSTQIHWDLDSSFNYLPVINRLSLLTLHLADSVRFSPVTCPYHRHINFSSWRCYNLIWHDSQLPRRFQFFLLFFRWSSQFRFDIPLLHAPSPQCLSLSWTFTLCWASLLFIPFCSFWEAILSQRTEYGLCHTRILKKFDLTTRNPVKSGP